MAAALGAVGLILSGEPDGATIPKGWGFDAALNPAGERLCGKGGGPFSPEASLNLNFEPTLGDGDETERSKLVQSTVVNGRIPGSLTIGNEFRFPAHSTIRKCYSGDRPTGPAAGKSEFSRVP